MGRVSSNSVRLTAKINVKSSIQPAVAPPAAQTPAKPFASSSTVILPRVNIAQPAPNKTSIRAKSSQWKCSSCGDNLDAKSVLEGKSALFGGVLVCVECQRRSSRIAHKQRQQRKVITALVIGSVASVAIALVFFPAQSLVLALTIGGLLVASGILAFTLSKTTRLAVLLLGLSTLGASAWGLLALHQTSAAAESAHVAADKAQQIRNLLKQNCYRQAQLNLAALDRASRNPNGTYISSDAQTTVQRLNVEIESWIVHTYGQLGGDEHALLLKLLAKYSESRLRSLSYSGSSVKLTVVAELADEQMEARHVDIDKSGSADPLQEQAEKISAFVAAEAPHVQDIELQLVSADGATLKTLSTAVTLK
jgi:hypothetical protein